MVVVAHGVDRGSELAAASEEDDGYSTSTTDDDDDDDDVEPHGPASSGLRWVPYAAAVSAVRALLGASHHDLRLRAHQLSRSLSAVFFAGAGNEGAVLVCADVPPLGPALRDAQRTMVRVAAEEADHAACDCYYDAVRDVMRLLVGDAGLFSLASAATTPAPAVAAASALRWVPHAAAVSAVRALLGASHEDLRLRVHGLSRSLSGAFFAVGAAAAPFASGARFPEGKLFVCADLPPLGPALVAAQRAMMQVAVKDASHGPCDWYFDTVGELMRLLVGDTGVGPAVFDRASFESAFALEWEN
ncbi:hypothetical protein OsJ_29474 [Oryza sativa Japonica Group]|uniref:Uncharacterized protein n=1 Tax=Oryza sativa subsp. japonica TaxID=39947 RepID=B9G3R7_ORYSJ|nr:hypothetical protein OsJ_29474 [Oryza sativa Japonica Group]